MKSKDFQRNITPSSKRQLGGSHDLGRLARVRDKELDHAARKRGSGRRSKHGSATQPGNPASQVSIVVLSIAGAAVLGIFLTIWVLLRAGGADEGVAKLPSGKNGTPQVVSRLPSPSESEAVAIVKQALRQRDPARIAKQVRLGAASAEEASRFFSELEKREGVISRYDWLSSMDQGATLIEGVSVAFEKDHLKGQRLALLTPDEKGVWKLDYESFARRVSPSWDEILRGDAPIATVRVVVGEDSYFNGPFTEGAWSCFGLASPDMDEVMHSYCKVGSAEEIALKELFKDGTRLCRAVLELRRVAGAGPRQFEVSKVIMADWLLPGDS